MFCSDSWTSGAKFRLLRSSPFSRFPYFVLPARGVDWKPAQFVVVLSGVVCSGIGVVNLICDIWARVVCLLRA